EFEQICDYERIPGLVENCGSGDCEPVFGTFGFGKKKPIYDALFTALDTNDDDRIDGEDDACEVNLLTFSWGGATAAKIAAELPDDERVSDGHGRITRLLLIEPYRPTGRLVIPDTVRTTRVWRQSSTPATDCSRYSPAGPYRGFPPECPDGADCVDTDLSTGGEDYEIGGVVVDGDEIGHCLVPAAVRDPLMEALYDAEHLAEVTPEEPESSPLSP
ncbi:MAG: hypothetical protein R3324_17485, partial [Halobacteriales archaeon]|nr:hypothetical protein [Halobacteriales archaeon]